MQTSSFFNDDRCDDRPDSPYAWASTWGISLCFHVAILVVLALTLTASVKPGVPVEGTVHSVEIALKTDVGGQTVYDVYEESGGGGGDDTPDAAEGGAFGAESSQPSAAGIQRILSDSPTPNVPDFHSSRPGLLPQVGTGGNGISSAGEGIGNAGKIGGPGFGPGFGHGKVGFMGIVGTGRSFTYVLDRSGSMEGTPLAAAKAELRKSLEQMQSNQQFQIIFYNDRVNHLVKLTLATERERRQASSLVAAVPADGGTDHMAALQLALAHRTDVIFFLTDADSPPMTSQDLESIRKTAAGSVQINTIQFGIGPKSSSQPNFLEKLAAQNDGKYTYVDVKTLR